MTTDRAALYPTPPPTSNALNTKQRTRLVRSTRKLGKILGTTPLVAEADVPQPVAVSLYSESISSASSSRSTTPDSTSTKASRRHASICSYTPSAPSFLYSSPSGMSSVVSLALPPNRVSSLTKKASMKFMPAAKPRGSGELPRPLVLRLNAIPQPIKVPQRQPHSPVLLTPSGLLTPGTPTPTGTPAFTPTTPVFPSPAETRRKRMAKLTRTLGEIIPPHLVFASKKPAALTGDAGSLYSSPTSEEQPQPATITRKRRSMSVDYSGKSFPSFPRSSRVWATGNETWRGEWNRKDIKDVQKQLRSLKSR